MKLLISFLPITLFILLYVGSGVYFTLLGEQNAFYKLSPTVAIIPSIIFAWLLQGDSITKRMDNFIEGIRHRDIITMCLIFLLAGAFNEVAKSIGSIEAVINIALTWIPSKFLLLGIFLTSAFISTCIGTSMGTIGTIGPIAASLASQGTFSPNIAMATVVGGAIFGDNLSLISDTTIASVMSQKADLRAKLRINVIIAAFASIITLCILWQVKTAEIITIEAKSYSITLILPYLILLTLALTGVNVFITLVLSILFAGLIGFISQDYTVWDLSTHIQAGFTNMYDIMLLSLLIGGLSGLTANNANDLGNYLNSKIGKIQNIRIAQFVIAKIVSIFDILLANNTIAIICSGEISKTIAKKYNIPPHYTAAWLDIFSCVFQGLIPYGAQILLASKIANISPLSITPHVYYCYSLAIVSIVYISCNKSFDK